MTRPSLPAPINAKPLHFTMLATVLCVLTSAYIAERSFYWSKLVAPLFQKSHRHSAVNLAIGPHQFSIPAGYISSARHRAGSQSSGSNHQQVSLLMTWPDMKMPGDEDAPTRFGVPVPLIKVDLENDPYRESLRSQLDPVYKRLARNAGVEAGAGLAMLRLSTQEADDRDIIVYDPATEDGFIARCIKKRITDTAVCHRTITPGAGLLIRYQFDQSLLAEWRALDLAVKVKVSRFHQM